MVVVDAVGASPREHASLATEQSRATLAAAARVEGSCGASTLVGRLPLNLVARERDQRHLQPLESGQQPQNFLGFAARREREHHIASNHHAQIAVHRLDRMQKQGRASRWNSA